MRSSFGELNLTKHNFLLSSFDQAVNLEVKEDFADRFKHSSFLL